MTERQQAQGAYRAWLRTKSCVVDSHSCYGPVDAAFSAVPMCRKHHEEIARYGHVEDINHIALGPIKRAYRNAYEASHGTRGSHGLSCPGAIGSAA